MFLISFGWFSQGYRGGWGAGSSVGGMKDTMMLFFSLFFLFFLYTIILFFLTELGGNFVFLSKINACIGLFQWKKMELQAKWEVEDLNVQKKIKKIWGSIQEHKLHIKIKQKLCKIDPQAELTNMWKSILVYYDPNDGNVMYPKNVIKSISNFRPVNTLNVNKTCLLQQIGENVSRTGPKRNIDKRNKS